jgi:hypothetical protein
MKKTRIMYMELKTHDGGHDDRGEARIGRVALSKSGRSVHYRGKTLQRTNGTAGCGNYFDVETNEVYWVSGPKQDGTDRYYWGKSAPVEIDEDIREEYWTKIRKQPERVTERYA